MKSIVKKVPMNSLAGRATLGLALSATAMSLVSTWFVPLGGFWPSLAWAVVGGVAGLWAIQVLARPTPTMGAVIARVEAEAPGAVRASAKLVERGAIS